MAEARGRFEWKQTAWILSTLHNANRGQDAEPVTWKDYFPYKTRKPKEPQESVLPFEVLRWVFCPEPQP